VATTVVLRCGETNLAFEIMERFIEKRENWQDLLLPADTWWLYFNGSLPVRFCQHRKMRREQQKLIFSLLRLVKMYDDCSDDES
jgi:hypothetical protein